MTALSHRLAAWAVHAYTASGVVFALLAAIEIAAPAIDARVAFLWLFVAVLIDATDGPLARLAQVGRWLPDVSGRKIDDIVDYLTFTFLPLLLVWRMGWLADPAPLWISIALIASLFGFANEGAKEDDAGFFRGFPSYWNVFAFYVGIASETFGPLPGTVALVVLAVLTVMPIRLLYPNRAPRGWRRILLLGAYAWAILLVPMMIDYPRIPVWLLALSLVYPVFYTAASFHLSRQIPKKADPMPH